VSWGRPIYLWNCLDALWRFTKIPAKFILLDNFHPDPLVGDVISGYQRRGLLDEVVRFDTNHVHNLATAYSSRLKDTGPLHVYMESDVVIAESTPCWLSQMKRIMDANPQIGLLGSLIDSRDFVPKETAIELVGGDLKAAENLAKLNSPERQFIPPTRTMDFEQDFITTEPPFPLTNPPGRLLMIRSEVIGKIPLRTDSRLANHVRSLGMDVAITPKVRHRHLSLLNIFDYPFYASHVHRSSFFHPLNS
jgi:hypothetical protein